MSTLDSCGQPCFQWFRNLQKFSGFPCRLPHLPLIEIKMNQENVQSTQKTVSKTNCRTRIDLRYKYLTDCCTEPSVLIQAIVLCSSGSLIHSAGLSLQTEVVPFTLPHKSSNLTYFMNDPF